MNDNVFDVIIIGAGPIGLACGIQAVKHNKSHLILEKGCLVNSVFHYPVNMTFFSTSDKLEIGDIPFVSHGDKPTRREALEYYRRVYNSWKLNANLYERVKSVKKKGEKFLVISSKQKYLCDNIIIATGFYDNPNKLNIPGENLPKVLHYFNEAHPYAYKNVAVIGAGNSAVDVALETFRRGANVSMIIKENKLKDTIKYWVLPDIKNRIKEKSIAAYFNSEVIEIQTNKIIVRTKKGIVTLENDFVFAMTGYHPDYSFLKSMGINILNNKSLKPEFDPDTFETNVKGVFLAGVVCGGMETGKWFIENSRFHPEKIFEKISADYSKNI